MGLPDAATTEMKTTVLKTKLVIRGSRFGSPRKAIRNHCLWCAGTANEVRLCPCTDCPTWPHRFGRQPEKVEAKGEMVDPEVADAAGWREDPEIAWARMKQEATPNAN